MVLASCSLSILAARTDLPFLMQTVPHIVRGCNFQFSDRLLAVDTAPLSGDKVNRPGIGTLDELRQCCHQLKDAGVVDRVEDIDYSDSYRQEVYRKHFGLPIRNSHNYKGYPILGTIFSIENPQTDYLVHFDSDMLLHSEPDYSWVEEGIKLLQQNPDVIAVRPLTGPPTSDGSIHQQVDYEYDRNGFYRFNFFSSRVYLIDCKRFEKLLPLPALWRSYNKKILNRLPNGIKTMLNYLTNKGQLDSWEVMVSRRLEETKYVRATMESPKAWTIHPKDRSPEFLEALPDIIKYIEAGWYPMAQAGYYDLDLKSWLPIPAGAVEAEQKDWEPIWLSTPDNYQAHPNVQTTKAGQKN